MFTRAAGLAAVVALAAVTVAVPAHAKPDKEPDLSDVGSLVDKVAKEQLEEGEVPGAAVSIVSGGEEIYSQGYGYADIDDKTPVDPDTTGFYAASTAKLFTAAAVLQLEAKGKLDLDADVNEYLDFDIPDTHPGEPITVEHLLTHTSGFDPDYGMLGKSVTDAEELMSLRDSVVDYLPERVEPPGTVLAYDNYGVTLAGYIVERVSETPYDEYIRENVHKPLGMTGSTATQPHPDTIAKNLATGYRLDGDKQVTTPPNFDPWTPTGPGHVVTAADMSRFMIDQLSNDSLLGEGIPENMMKQHHTSHAGMPGIGYVYEEQPRNGQRVLAKDGDGMGFHNDMILLPEHDLGIFFAVNGDGGDGLDLAAIGEAVTDTYYPGDDVGKPTAVDDSDVSEYEGVYQGSRVSRHSIAKLRVVGQSRVIVTANADGTLTTSDKTLSTHADADSQKWVQTKPGFFREVDGRGTIAFEDGVLTGSTGQNQVYLKQAWYESPVLHLYLTAAALVAMLAGVIVLPIVALRRRGQSGPGKFSRLLGWLTSALAVAVVVGLYLLLSNRDVGIQMLWLGSPLVYAIMTAASVVVLGAAGMAVASVVSWLRGWWRVSGRVSYSLLSLAALTFASIAVTYNFTGPPFD
ncbi:serine hydrolase domain-containing protein [Stackebrandtia nassauensis]|nr:serine hydrolase domain-containing protein [Stackebrandtia nassauensis]